MCAAEKLFFFITYDHRSPVLTGKILTRKSLGTRTGSA
jgi:hypothetical protein